MDTIFIRRATEQDIDALMSLYDEFHRFHVLGVPDRLRTSDPSTPTEQAALSDALSVLLHREDAAMFVALVSLKSMCARMSRIHSLFHIATVTSRASSCQRLSANMDWESFSLKLFITGRKRRERQRYNWISGSLKKDRSISMST